MCSNLLYHNSNTFVKYCKKGFSMTERKKLEVLLEEVKRKIRMLDAIEERLLDMRNIAIKSSENTILNNERSIMQLEVNNLIQEIKILELDTTICQ